MVLDTQNAPYVISNPTNAGGFVSSNKDIAFPRATEPSPPAPVPPIQETDRRGFLVEESVRSEALRLAWLDCMSGLTECSPAERKDCMASVAVLRSEFLDACAEVTEADDRAALAVVFYVNLKSRWIMLNLFSCYRIESGKPNALLMAQLGMLSALLDSVEKALSREDIAVITEFLAHPVPRPAPRNPLLAPLPAPTVSLPALTHHNSRKLREMRETIALHDVDMADARQKDAYLQQELGTANGAEIVKAFREVQSQFAALKDLQELIGGMENVMNFVNE